LVTFEEKNNEERKIESEGEEEEKKEKKNVHIKNKEEKKMRIYRRTRNDNFPDFLISLRDCR